jgi:uncharacterized protein
MRQRIWRAGKIGAGLLLLVLGVAGLFLPFLQGILFLVMGLTLLSTESRHAKALLTYLQRRTGRHGPDERPTQDRTEAG